MSRTGGSVVAGIIMLAVMAVLCVPTAGASGPWVPAPGLRWQYQLQGTFNPNLCVVPYRGGACVRPNVYDLDLYATNGVTLNSAAVAAVHAAGGHAVCYVDAGTWENWRPDANKYPSSVLGNKNGWPGERWVDIRDTSVLLPIMSARVAKCAAAHFDAVEFDNVDGYTNNTGFALTAAEQFAFDEDLASIAHGDGLSVGLKNDLGQLSQLESTFDFAINEQCAQYHECAYYSGWEAAHKAVVEVEYRDKPAKFCLSADLAGRDAMQKGLSLRAKPWRPCR